MMMEAETLVCKLSVVGIDWAGIRYWKYLDSCLASEISPCFLNGSG
jgi:hypothetical protein